MTDIAAYLFGFATCAALVLAVALVDHLTTSNHSRRVEPRREWKER